MEGSGSSGTYPLWFEELLLFTLFADEGLEGENISKSSASKPALQTYLLASNIKANDARNDQCKQGQ